MALQEPADDAPNYAVDPTRELMITDLSVVEDPLRTTWPPGRRYGSQAAWTFGRIMEQLAGCPERAPQFTMDWLTSWENDQVINGFISGARPLIRDYIVDPWLAASGGSKLDLRKAPFRLLAIVNRLDLRTSYDLGSRGGEGRFVFGATKPDGTPLQFTVIFEFGVPALSGDDVKNWAKKWHKLGAMPFGADYNRELERITAKFVKTGCAPWKPNGSCINQIRTNDISLSPLPRIWELREFRLSPLGKIKQVVTARTPDTSINGTATLADFINANQSAAIAKTHETPPAFLGASAPEGPIPWSAPGILDNEARHGFGFSTCGGCHTAETGTRFTHVKPRPAGQAAQLSGFLTGTTAEDPITHAPRSFNELEARAEDMQGVLASDPSAIAPRVGGGECAGDGDVL